MNRATLALCAILAAGLVACDPEAPTPAPEPEAPEAPEAPEQPQEPEQPEPEQPEPEQPEPEARPGEDGPERPRPAPVDVDTVNGGQADLAPTPAPWQPPNRARRRMNIDQLDAAFRRTSGGIGWTEMRGNREVNLFEELSATLGKPDFIQITTESLEPSALFQKFLDDASRQVCARMVEVDQQRGAEPVLLPAPDAAGDVDIDAHLQHLVLRFHGRDLPIDSPDLMHWRWLYDSVVFVGDDVTGWQSVCATLFTHPDFYSY